MKKRFLLPAAVSLLFLINASVWEGAASVSSGGDFPSTGYYAATNSYPRNSVVDITNLENGITVRVVILSGLENPGILTVLSRDAADAIGLNPRSVGRVRMSQPSDPMSSLINGINAGSGDPDHDPAAMIAAAGLNPDLFTEESWLVFYNEDQLPAEMAAASVSEELPRPEMTVPEPAAPETAVQETAEAETPAKAMPFLDPLQTAELELQKADPQQKAMPTSVLQSASALPDVSIPVTEPAAEDTITELALPPAEIQQPVVSYEIDPKDILDTWSITDIIVSSAPQATVTSGNDHDYIDPVYFIDPITAAALPANIPVETAAVAVIPQESIISVLPDTVFSVPLINSLEIGKYYIQLAAFGKTENVESELDKIGRAWPLAVQGSGTPDNPVYRILVGPVNLGESGALLQRFKGTYKDAFVRLGS